MRKWISSITIIGLILIAFIFLYFRKNRLEVQNTPLAEEISINDKETIDNFWTHQRRATGHRIAGEWGPATQEYKKALAIDPTHENSIYHLGNMYLELDQYDSAEYQWTLLIQHNPTSARGHFQLGNLHFDYKNRMYYDLNVAKKEFETTFGINKDFMQPALQLGHIALLQNDISEAMDYYTKVIGSNRDNSEAYLLLGYSQFKSGNKKAASVAFEKAVNFSKSSDDSSLASSEGDTKDGKSLQRKTNSSPFNYFAEGLSETDNNDLVNEMEKKYHKIDSLISIMDPDTSI